MRQILDYEELFNEAGEQDNICTNANIGGDYKRVIHLPHPEDIKYDSIPEALSSSKAPQVVSSPRRPVRYVDFDTFENPDRSQEEVMEGFKKTTILFASVITAIVAIAILL